MQSWNHISWCLRTALWYMNTMKIWLLWNCWRSFSSRRGPRSGGGTGSSSFNLGFTRWYVGSWNGWCFFDYSKLSFQCKPPAQERQGTKMRKLVQSPDTKLQIVSLTLTHWMDIFVPPNAITSYRNSSEVKFVPQIIIGDRNFGRPPNWIAQ